jgi:type I restriction enzyme R subunit
LVLKKELDKNLDNQKPEFIQNFFTTNATIVAGNNTQGLRYGPLKQLKKILSEMEERFNRILCYILDKHVAPVV